MTLNLKQRQVSYHDFAAKLQQGGLREVVLQYLQWRRDVRLAQKQGKAVPLMPPIGPLSINLDLTTACNYACDHCIDWDTLNSGIRHNDERLRASLQELVKRGLRSVILIGGGEPTLYPGFSQMVSFLKDHQLQIAVVTNGSRNGIIAGAAPRLTAGDWVRLSLDAGSDGVFQAMHHPKGRGIHLDEICESAQAIKAANSEVTLGYSFVIVWRGAQRDQVGLVENIHEMSLAAARAREFGFDYISFKPFLMRAPDGAEVLEPEQAAQKHEVVLKRIQEQLDTAKQLQNEEFRIIESTNLKVLRNGTWQEYTRQPQECHMQALRQVLSPLGTFNCPAHRGVAKARVGDSSAWAQAGSQGAGGTSRLLEEFDASYECRNVTCLYNPVNRYLEDLITEGHDLETVFQELPDFSDSFL